MTKPEYEQTVWIETDDARRPDVLAQALMIVADGIKSAPKELVYALTAGVEHCEPVGHECFVVSVKGVKP